MPNGNINSSLQDFVAKANGLKHRFLAPVPVAPPYSLSCPPVHNDSKQLLIVVLQNIWADFCRELVEHSANGRGPTTGGTILTPISFPTTFPNMDNFLKNTATKIANEMPHRGEYAVWHSVEYVNALMEELKPSNYVTVQSGLGSISAAKNINIVRSYIVHSNASEYEKLLNRKGARGLSVVSFLSMKDGGSLSIFEEWVNQLIQGAKNASV